MTSSHSRFSVLGFPFFVLIYPWGTNTNTSTRGTGSLSASDAGDRSAASQVEDPTSVLHLYRRLLLARRASPALRLGDISYPDGAPEGVLAWHRTGIGADRADRRTVLVNQLDADVVVPPALWDALVVEVASDGIGEGDPFDGGLRADAAVVLRPG